MEQTEKKPEDADSPDSGPTEGASLESTDSQDTLDATSSSSSSSAAAAPPPKKGGLKGLVRRFNIYLLIFIFILLVAGGIILVAYTQSKSASTTGTLKTQELTQNTLNQVANSDATVGNSQQILSVQSSAVFAGKVLVRQDLEVAGNIQIGGTVGLTNLTVAGSTQLGQVQVNKDLSVAGNTAIQGSASISKSLQVNGGGTFNGSLSAPQISTSNLNLNSDLTLTHHIVAGGATPGRSNGGALGGGGSSSISGSDTAGTISINTGTSPGAGCLITVNFTQKYNSVPHILLTPVGSTAGGLSYYVNRNAANFSVCVANPAPSGSSFGFDYFVID